MLPNFLLIGAMKSGTTSLDRFLRQHPEIFLPTVKELHFFTYEDRWRCGLESYEACFDEHQCEPLIGEASTSYTKNQRPQLVADRIAHTLPDAQLIYIVRNPVDRMFSHYKHLLGNGIGKSFVACIQEEDLVDVSCYYEKLTFFLKHYPEDRILVLFFDDLIERPREVVAKTFAFLGVDASFVPRQLDLAHNTSDKKFARLENEHRVEIQSLLSERGTLTPEVRKQVINRLQSDLRNLSRYTGRRLHEWNPEVHINRYFPER
jgi:hypothetical protein